MINSVSIRLRHRYNRFRAFISAPRLQIQTSVVMEGEIEPCANPILVMGCHRSGTSLLQRILNSHNNIACPPETFFLAHFCDMLDDPKVRSGLSGIVEEKEIDKAISNWAFRFHEAFRESNNKSRWADKTPEYVRIYPQLIRLAPPDTKVLVLLRDPFDIAYSIIDRGWNLAPDTGDVFIDTLTYVKTTMAQLLDLSSQPSNHTIRYEELATNPEIILREMCAFLDEPWDDSMLRPWDQQQNFGTGDPIVRGKRGFQISQNNWLAFSTKQRAQLQDILGDIRGELGYSDA
jgi:hypothetical protein